MAFQTNVFRGGEWVTETVNIQSVLNKAGTSTHGQRKQRLLKAPQCGILTSTVVESQLFHSVMPVRLRSPRLNDVAFVGDHHVWIREFRSDGQLKDVAKKSDFASRIRNACVVGSFDIREPDNKPDLAPSTQIKAEDDQFQSGELPPQLLMIALECGDCVFLCMERGADGVFHFVTTRHPSPHEQLVYPGFHLDIDPSSRYMVLACAQDFFVVYELESHDNLAEQYRNKKALVPIRAGCPRSVQGVIHKVHFLYPQPGGHGHVILLLIIVRNGRSRMVTYEWTLGDDLQTVFAEEKPGHRMPVENQMPVLIIPLTVRSAFIAISPDQVAVCTEVLYGPPNFETVAMENRPATRNYHGRHTPLWTAWARPFRLSPYFNNRDCMYLAREDGVVIFIEADSESALDRSTYMDTFDSNISSTFTCLFDQYTDVLILGSDSGPGGIWKVPARQPPELLGILPNWSPVVDFATTDECARWDQRGTPSAILEPEYAGSQIRKPDRVFATSGHGQKGSITEYRFGLKAGIGLDIDYGTEVTEAWLLPSNKLSTGQPSTKKGFFILMSMPDCSAVLHLSEDLSTAEVADPAALDYGISSRTLAISVSGTGNHVVQVTTESVVLLGPENRTCVMYEDILPLPRSGRLMVSDACIFADVIAIAAHTNTQYIIHVLQLDMSGHKIAHNRSIQVDGDVTCLAAGAGWGVVAGIWKDGRAFLGHERTVNDHSSGALKLVDIYRDVTEAGWDAAAAQGYTGAISTIVAATDCIVLGTRSGEVFRVSRDSVQYEKFGLTTAKVTRGRDGCSILVTCDKSMVLLQGRAAGITSSAADRTKDKLRIWAVDASDLSAPSPPVDYAVAIDLPSNNPDVMPMLMISGTKLLLANLQPQAGPVHRYLPLGGTPTKVIYSKHLQCLIVAVNQEDKPTLMFLDPDTGKDLGRAVDKSSNTAVEFISGLGKPGDRIFGLAEWEFKEEEKAWRYILVTTRQGRVLAISATRSEAREDRSPLIRYWIQFQRKGLDRPVYSVVGQDKNLMYCVGQTIHWDKLDTTKKKLQEAGVFPLPSPATSLKLANGRLMALTSRDSVEIINYMPESEAGPCHVDPKTRNSTHMIDVAGPDPEEPLESVTLIADRDCGVTGLWVPWQLPGRDCEVVFEAELPTSIRRFRRGRTRPMWEQSEDGPKSYGRLRSTVDDAEILGISLDGSMQHFTLLSVEAWRLLRFLQNMAISKTEGMSAFDPLDLEPRMDRGLEMHVDGDLLRRCYLDTPGALEELLSQHEGRFWELLHQISSALRTSPGHQLKDACTIASDMLNYYLGPVL